MLRSDTTQKMKLSIKDFDLVTCTEGILNGKLRFSNIIYANQLTSIPPEIIQKPMVF